MKNRYFQSSLARCLALVLVFGGIVSPRPDRSEKTASAVRKEMRSAAQLTAMPERSIRSASSQLAAQQPPALCPGDNDPTDRAIFERFLLDDKFQPPRVVAEGTYTNPQLQQTFIITVSGVLESAVRTYAENLRLCLAAVRSGQPKDEAEEFGPSTSNEILGQPDTENLVIDFALDQRNGQLFVDGYNVFFVIDPGIARGSVHDYRKYCQNSSATAKIWMSGGVGSVSATLTRNRVSPGDTVVFAPNDTALPAPSSGTATYDLIIVGRAGGLGDVTSNRYRVSGTWNFAYEATTPTGGGSDCIPITLPSQTGVYGDPSFREVWERTDRPVAEGRTGRSWIWGRQCTAAFGEPYSDSPGGSRLVQYFDKSRMEINNPSAARNQWYVTNGLLVEEMIDGRVQLANNTFENRVPSDEAVAGDPAAQNPDAPTYRSFRSVSYPVNSAREPDRTGQLVTARIAVDGSVSNDSALAMYNVRFGTYESTLGHNIPGVFTNFFNSAGLVYAGGAYRTEQVMDWRFVVGLPISEPYWATVQVGGFRKDVLMQAFERRVLTYTPSNSATFRTEMGNVGQHYLRWRYDYSC